MRKLSKEPIRLEDIKREGEKEWQIIKDSFTPLLKWNRIDFSDLEQTASPFKNR